MNLYEADFYHWTREQSQILGNREWEKLDVEYLVEEIAELGSRHEQQLESRLRILLAHLLKWQHQAERRSNSWQAPIREQRRGIRRLLDKNPSLMSHLSEAFAIGYEDGLDLAVKETNLSFDTFSLECPYSLEQVLDNGFLPE